MGNLITDQELATWTQREVSEVAQDPFAREVLDKVSGLVRFLAGQPTWELQTTPFDARLVALMVAKRTYENPTQEVQSNVGPIGSRVLDVAAMLLELTESERSTLTKYNLAGDPNEKSTGLWVQRIGIPEEQVVPTPYFVPDDSYSDWYIPMFSPLDPGDPNLYTED